MGPEASRAQVLLLVTSMICTLSLLAISSVCFVYNFSRIFKMNKTKKRLIEIGSVFTVVCVIFDIVSQVGALDIIRMKSCYRQDLVWPIIVLLFEIFCKFLPLYCFTRFFSTKLSLYSQN